MEGIPLTTSIMTVSKNNIHRNKKILQHRRERLASSVVQRIDFMEYLRYNRTVVKDGELRMQFVIEK